MNVIDCLPEEHRDTFVAELERRAPDLLPALRTQEKPIYSQWEAVEDILADAFTEHYGPNHDPTDTGVKIDGALAAFMGSFPLDDIADAPPPGE